MKKDLRGVVDAARRWGKASARVRQARSELMAARAAAAEARKAADDAGAEFHELVDECAEDVSNGEHSSGEAVGRAGGTWRSRLEEAKIAEGAVTRVSDKVDKLVVEEQRHRQAFMGAVDAAPEGVLE